MEQAVTDTNLIRFRAAVAGALAHLESRRKEVNDLNVFPVADGDTGDNMVLTLRAVLEELDRLQDGNAARTIDEIGREEIVQSVARAALLGARGNSGVILSQLIRGAAEELVSRPGQLIDATLIGAALANAADRAYASVREPAEGTILTVAREMAHGIMADLAHSEDAAPTRSGDRAARAGSRDRKDARTRGGGRHRLGQARAGDARGSARRRRRGCRRSRPDGDLRRCGGGVARRGAARSSSTMRRPRSPIPSTARAPTATAPISRSSAASWCRPALPRPLERLGDSVLVVGDPSTLKIHLHTDEPERATALFDGVGEVSHLDVADMRAR